MLESGKNRMFNNECKIAMHFSAGRYVKRPFGETNNKIKSAEFGDGHQMAWGCIRSDSRKNLVKVDINLSNENYINLFQSNFVSDDKRRSYTV